MDNFPRLILALLVGAFFPGSFAVAQGCASYRVTPSSSSSGTWTGPGWNVDPVRAVVGSKFVAQTEVYNSSGNPAYGSTLTYRYTSTIIGYVHSDNPSERICTVHWQEATEHLGIHNQVDDIPGCLIGTGLPLQVTPASGDIPIEITEPEYYAPTLTLQENGLAPIYYGRTGETICTNNQRYTLTARSPSDVYLDLDNCYTVGGLEKCLTYSYYDSTATCESCSTGDSTPDGSPPVGDRDGDGTPDDQDSSPFGNLDAAPPGEWGPGHTGSGGDTGGGDTGGGDTGGGDTGGGDTGGGDGDGTGDGWGGSCSEGFTCTGGPIDCAIARASWTLACLFDTSGLGDKAAAGEAAMAASGAGVASTDASVGDFDTTNPFSVSCVSDVTVGVSGASFTIPLSLACPYLAFIGWVLVAGATLGGARIALT